MAAFDKSRTLWTYTDDQGGTASINALTGYTTQAAVLGGSAAAAGLKALPRGRKPRHAIVLAAGKRVKVICFEPGATAFTTPTTAVNVPIGDVLTAGVVQTSEGERHRGRNT